MRTDLGECTIWGGRLDRHGYGRRGNHLAHRVLYEERVGPIPPGLDIDHLCRVRACVNIAHLEPVTRAENNRRRNFTPTAAQRNAAKTHCVNGHEFTIANTYLRPNGCRDCRRCIADRVRRYKRRTTTGANA